MKRVLGLIGGAAIVLGLVTFAIAEEKHQTGGKGIKGMSKEQLIELAMSAAPADIAKEATVMVPGEDGKTVEAKKGTNGFTCFPDVDGQEVPDPICADPAATQWAGDLMSGAPKPTNAVPGIAYMGKGGWHFEKDGKILMKPEPGAKRVKEPPHWMVFFPFDGKTTGLKDMPNPMGVYIMFEGTPYSHLMIYQNPIPKSKK